MTVQVINARWQMRRKTAAEWTASNEILRSGEKGYETDTGKEKNGNGVTGWNALAYAGGAGGAGATNLSIANRTASTLDVVSDAGTDATIPAATASLSGLLNAGSPPALGDFTPAAGTFSDLAASTTFRLPSAVPGAPLARHLYPSLDTIRYRDSSNAERLLLNSADNLANLGNTATARTNLGGVPTLTGVETLTSKTLGNLREGEFTITDAAAFEIDPASGPFQAVTLGANRTPLATNFLSGQSVKLTIFAAGFSITWASVGVVWVSITPGVTGPAPVLGATGKTHIELWREGSVTHGALIGYSAT